ncbi:MAG: hypothetical protein KAU02_05985 [Tenericutes bacterium]|nr:hypothetical protein [Mycoplasmatota bacterium]
MKKILILILSCSITFLSACQTTTTTTTIEIINDEIASEKMSSFEFSGMSMTEQELIQIYDVFENHTLVNKSLDYGDMFIFLDHYIVSSNLDDKYYIFRDDDYLFSNALAEFNLICHPYETSYNPFDLRQANPDSKLYFIKEYDDFDLEYLIYKTAENEFNVMIYHMVDGNFSEFLKIFNVHTENETIYSEDVLIYNVNDMINELFVGNMNTEDFTAGIFNEIHFVSASSIDGDILITYDSLDEYFLEVIISDNGFSSSHIIFVNIFTLESRDIFFAGSIDCFSGSLYELYNNIESLITFDLIFGDEGYTSNKDRLVTFINLFDDDILIEID